MKVLHLNTELEGGAAIAARRIHAGVALQVDSGFVFRNGIAAEPSFRRLETGHRAAMGSLRHLARALLQRVETEQHLRHRPVGCEPFSAAHHGSRSFRPPWDPERLPDVIHLHWIAGMFDLTAFFGQLPADLPVVWSLHDMNPFTGGCHYTGDCDGFKRGCGNCPQIANPSSHDLSSRSWRVKREALLGRNLHVVANSLWVESLARSSPIFAEAKTFRTIYYGIDMATFAPRDKLSCRRALRLPEEGPLIAFGAHHLANPRKGLSVLLAALEQIREYRPQMLTFGHGAPPPTATVPWRHFGPIESQDLLAAVYSAADVLAFPSLDEAFGQIALEALACGTPVVAFSSGGVPEFVIDGLNGRLVPPGNGQAFATALREMIGEPAARQTLAQQSAASVRKEFSTHTMGQRYCALYQQIVAEQ